jgi:hypothetical protein
MARVLASIAACLCVALLAGCTSVGIHSSAARAQLDFGAPDTVSLCLYLDEGISEQHARALVENAWRDEAPLYGLQIKVASVTRWQRPAFMMDGIIDELLRKPLTPGCDRIFALVGRHMGDVVWGILLPEMLGAVNEETLTHGYAIARRATLNQIFTSPTSIVRHEIYHLLGCDEHFHMKRCYEQIASLKRWKQAQRSDFFPAWDLVNQRMLVSREAVNARLRSLAEASASTLGAQ